MNTTQTDAPTSETPADAKPSPIPLPLPIGGMITRGLIVASAIALLGGALALVHSVEAAMGVAMGTLAPVVASAIGLAIVGPTKARPPGAWVGLLIAAQTISLFLTVTIALALLYSATQPTQVAALPAAAVVFVTLWIVFAKSYGRSAVDSQRER